MATNGIKTYQIKINGIDTSIDAVKSLEKELFNLEERINALNKLSINIKTTGVNVGSVNSNVSTPRVSNVSSLSEEEAIQREINKLKAEGERLDAKIVAAQDEIYKRVDATKQLYKETIADQKALAAQERLDANSYNTNTMQGMKERLADLKAVINTTDLSDTDALNKMTQEANQLNEKLKEVEATYGQFGRNVGNYKSAFDGLTIAIGNTTAHFDSAKQAAKELDKEMKTLSTKKDQGIISEEEAQRLKDLIPVVAQLKSSINDAGKPMDALMDSMQSVVALTQVEKGLSAFFGIDNTEVEKTIKNLVALQNAMQGLQTVQKQLNSQEGIGKIFSESSANIDKFVAGITNAKIGAEGLTKASKVGTMAVRGLSMALKGIGIGLVIEAISLLVDGISWVTGKISDWVKGNADLVKEEKLLEAQLDFVNKKLEDRNDELAKSYYQGAITQEEYFRKSLEETTNVINEQIKALKERAAFEGGSLDENLTKGLENKEVSMSWGGGTREVENLDELTKLWKEYTEAVDDHTDAMSKYAEKTGSITAWFKSFMYTLDDTKDDLTEIGQIAIGEFLKKYEHAMQTMAIDTKEGEKELEALKKSMDDNEMLRSIFMNLDQYVPVESFRKRIQQIINLIRGVKTEMGDMEQRTVQQVLRSEQLKIDAMKDGAAKRQAQRDLDKKKELADATLTAEDKANIEKKYQQRALKEEKNANQKLKGEADKNKKAQLEIEKEIASARIAAMKEGLNKTITQLEEERKQRLAKLDKNMKNYKSYELQINNIYNERILRATEDWNLKMEKTYADMWRNINQDTLNNLKEQYDLIKQYYEQSGQTPNNMDIGSPTSDFSKRNVIPSYGMLASKGLKEETKEALGLTATFDTTKFGEDMRKYVDLERQASVVMEEYYKKYEELQEEMKSLKIPDSEENDARLGRLNLELDETLKVHKKLQKAYIEYGKYVNETYGEIEVRKRANLLYEEAYSDKLSTLFKQRNANIEYEQRQADIRLEDELEATTKKLNDIAYEEYSQAVSANQEHYDALVDQADAAYEKDLDGYRAQLKYKLISKEEFIEKEKELDKRREDEQTSIWKNYDDKNKQLNTKYEQEITQIKQDANQKRQDNNKKSFEKQLQELRDFQTAIVNIESKQPVQNAWGITNFTETNKNNRNILDSYKTMVERINQMRADLNAKKNEGLIDDEMYSSTLRELDNLSQGIGEKMDEIKQKLSVGEQIGTFISDIQQYFNALGQGLQQIMQALWSAQDVAFDKEKEAIDKENEKLQDALDKNEEILERHRNNVNDIEDELSTARGDRRQHLIDQLNAEIAAEREAAAEEKRIKQQQEVQKKKEDALDRKRKEAQYKRDLQSILVSGAMAAVNAYATKPFVPVGLAMGSLSLALTAAQYAIAKSAKPYAHGGLLDSGVADGPRHSQGGIKVLGGRAEIEGGEFITNRVTTAKNIDLLEYVNSQKRKVDINDLIEFYSSGRPKKTVQSIRGRFAEGGNLPTLRTDISINDRLVSAFEDYAKTPNVVQVVDIIDRTKKVNNVKVLAGLSE